MQSGVPDQQQPAPYAPVTHGGAAPTIGFFMEQVAGHTTHYHTLRAALVNDAAFNAVWHDIRYFLPAGRLARLVARLPWLPAYPVGVLGASLQLRRAFGAARYDAILLNSRVGLFFPTAVRRTPCLLDTDVTPVQLDALPGYDGPTDPPLVAALKQRLFRTYVHGLRRVIAWSGWAADSFIKDYGVPPERVVVCPPGVDVDFWHPARSRTAADQPVRILFVGGDFQRKNGPALLRWFANHAPPGCELHIVTREPVPALPGVTVYHDMQPNTPRLRQLYQEADVFVLPSLGECFGIATVEAMACGLPVIVTHVGGAADIVVPGETGWLIPPGDERALGQTLTDLLGDATRRQAMGSAGRARAATRFDSRKTARQRLDWLLESASERRASTQR